MAWELLDEAAFNFTVPTGYETGTALNILLKETSESASRNHKWSAKYTVDNYAAVTVTSQVTSDATPGVISSRSITIPSTNLIAGCLITVVLSRIAAATLEDPEEIRVYTIDISLNVSSVSVAVNIPGRLGDIAEQVLVGCNDVNMDFLSITDIVKWCNECQRDIARRGYWEYVGSLDVVAATEDYVVSTQLGDLVALRDVRWNGTKKYKMKAAFSRGSYEDIKEQTSSVASATPVIYYYHNEVLSIYPTPITTATDALKVFYNYCPVDLNAATRYTPETPQAFDVMYINYCMRQAMQRDYTREFAGENWKRAFAQYQNLVQNLLAQNNSLSATRLISSRR
jgi:hypothetical protein